MELTRVNPKGLLHGLERTHPYRLTPYGRRIALFVTKVEARILRPGL